MDGLIVNDNFVFSYKFRSEIAVLEEFCLDAGIPGFEIYSRSPGNTAAVDQLLICYQWGTVLSVNTQAIHRSLRQFNDDDNTNGSESKPFICITENSLQAYPIYAGSQQWYFIVYHLNRQSRDVSPLSPAIKPVTQFFKQALLNSLKRDALLDEKTKYSHLFSAAPEGIVMLDPQNSILEVNPEFERMFQYAAHEIIGRNIDDLLAPGNFNEDARLLSKSNWIGNQVVVEARRIRRDGTLVDVSIMGVPFYHADGQLRVFAIYRDISDRIKHQQQKQRRIEFIEYISQLSSQLINLDIDNLDENIEEALSKVANLYGAERAYITSYDDAGGLVKITHEYALDTRFSHRQVSPGIPLSEIQELISRLKLGELLHLQRTDVGKDADMSELLYFFDLFNIETLVTIPLIGEQQFLGYIGFDTYSRPAGWHENTLNSFKLTAQIMANALARREREGALKQALIKAEASDKLKSAFLAGISHEIRTPMNHILGFLEMLNDPDIADHDRAEYLNIIKNSSNNLLHLIDDVIKTALIDSGQLSYRPGPCQLVRFLESLCIEAEGIKTSMNRVNVKINLLVEQSMRDEMIETDESKLRQVLWNLLTNALKYTPDGIIDFGFTNLKGEIVFFVSDTGIGIDKADHSSIFGRFYRIDNDYNREFGGAGLGLSISQGLASMLGKPIQVVSTPGTGATFRFSIPYIAYHLPAQTHSNHRYDKKSFDWEGKKILMVEDDPINMRFLAVMLLRTNAELLYAADGAEAVDIIKSQPVDLVLMDMQLPVMDGFEATRRIKQYNANIRVIAQTAMALREEKQQCMDAGCDDYLSKPITRQQLYEAIDRLLT